MKSLALIGGIIIIILGNIQAQFHEQAIILPTQTNILERDSISPKKPVLVKEDIDPFPISDAKMMEYHQADKEIISENNAAMNMEWALVKSDTSEKKK